jgi:hypothetical protein
MCAGGMPLRYFLCSAITVSEGADEGTFLKRCLFPALFAAFLLALYLKVTNQIRVGFWFLLL